MLDIPQRPLPPAFKTWLGNRPLASIGTNAGSKRVPFQDWRKFKEAFAPELIGMAVSSHPRKVSAVLDPFGGSGTTALACQFLGIHPTTIEVNPYLADLIEAKLSSYNPDEIASDLGRFLTAVDHFSVNESFYSSLPRTFVEPGDKGRWLFSRDLAKEAAAMILSLDSVTDDKSRRLFKVLLGACLVEVSNIVVSGKGRRYKKNWETKQASEADLRVMFVKAVANATKDVVRYHREQAGHYTLLRGDSRSLVREVGEVDVAIYSPPYPNSFDYTDVYNVELWALGYLRNSGENRALRTATISSHVQLARNYETAPVGSSTLERTLEALNNCTNLLWNKFIPSMIGAYFAELASMMVAISGRLSDDGRQWLVVGDSRYAGVDVPVATILAELAESRGLEVIHTEPFRSMRAAPQQGGRLELAETLLVLGRG